MNAPKGHQMALYCSVRYRDFGNESHILLIINIKILQQNCNKGVWTCIFLTIRPDFLRFRFSILTAHSRFFALFALARK